MTTANEKKEAKMDLFIRQMKDAKVMEYKGKIGTDLTWATVFGVLSLLALGATLLTTVSFAVLDSGALLVGVWNGWVGWNLAAFIGFCVEFIVVLILFVVYNLAAHSSLKHAMSNSQSVRPWMIAIIILLILLFLGSALALVGFVVYFANSTVSGTVDALYNLIQVILSSISMLCVIVWLFSIGYLLYHMSKLAKHLTLVAAGSKSSAFETPISARRGKNHKMG